MELLQTVQEFNQETIFNRTGKPPMVNFSHFRIEFSVAAVKLLGLKPGDRISFFTDAKDNGIIFFGKTKNGLSLRSTSEQLKTGVRLQICCRPLIVKLLSHFGVSKNKTFRISNETTDLYGQQMWFILKDKIHKPIQWRKKS